MPIHVSWYDNDQTIVYYNFEKAWKLDDLFVALDAGRGLMATVNHPVDSVLDFTNSTSVPQQMLSSAHSLERRMPENLRFFVAIRMNGLMAVVAKMMGKLAPGMMRKFKSVATLDQALALLEEMRQTSTVI